MGGGFSKTDVESAVDAKLQNYVLRDNLTSFVQNDDLKDLNQRLSSRTMTKQDFETRMQNHGLWCSTDGNICTVPLGFAYIMVTTPPNMTTVTHADSEGTYAAGASSVLNQMVLPFNAFNDGRANWESASRYTQGLTYNGTESTMVDGSPYPGEWLQIQLPYNLIVYKFDIWSGATLGAPRSFLLAGSTDGQNWSKLYETIDQLDWLASLPKSFGIKTNKAFSHFRLIISQVGSALVPSTSSNRVSIRRLSFNGMKQ
jgi:hypothetical protein